MDRKQVDASIATHLAQLQPIKGRDVKPNKEDHVFLSYGSPSPALFPLEAYTQSALNVLETDGKVALQYAGGEGTSFIKRWIIKRGMYRNLQMNENEILITAGAAQAIDFTTRLLINPGDLVWVEEPTYFFALHSFQLAGANIQMFPMDQEGIDVDYLEEALANRVKNNQVLPKLLYCMPNYHNPTGITLSLKRRKKLAQLARMYNFFIIEDDAYAELGFEQRHLPAIHSFAPERVLYLGSFSKVIAPGIRIGWVVAQEAFINKIKLLMLGPQTSPTTQEIVGKLLKNFPFEQHVNKLITYYEKNRDTMVAAIQTHFEDDVYFDIPAGGFFIWLKFKHHIDIDQFIDIAFEQGVSVVDGSTFFIDSVRNSSIRLCYSFCSAKEIELGIKRLAQAYVELISKQDFQVEV